MQTILARKTFRALKANGCFGGEAGRQALDRASFRSAFADLILDLSGGSFAFVMATGIISIAAMQLGHGEVGAGLFILNLVAFPLLCVLMLVRLFRHSLVIFGELRSHRTGAGFLTAVAATSIVGDQFVLFTSNSELRLPCGSHRWPSGLA